MSRRRRALAFQWTSDESRPPGNGARRAGRYLARPLPGAHLPPNAGRRRRGQIDTPTAPARPAPPAATRCHDLAEKTEGNSEPTPVSSTRTSPRRAGLNTSPAGSRRRIESPPAGQRHAFGGVLSSWANARPDLAEVRPGWWLPTPRTRATGRAHQVEPKPETGTEICGSANSSVTGASWPARSGRGTSRSQETPRKLNPRHHSR